MHNHLILNGLIFLACYGIAFCHHWLQYRKHMKMADHGKVGLFAGLVNPATVDSLKDFAIHIMIYSGYVIPSH